MIPGQTCGNCAAFAAMARECRRKPPTAVPIQNDKNQLQCVGFFPGTTHDRWCLEWRWDKAPTAEEITNPAKAV